MPFAILDIVVLVVVLISAVLAMVRGFVREVLSVAAWVAAVAAAYFLYGSLLPLVLRHEGQEYSFVGLRRSLRARGTYRPFSWEFSTGDRDVRISGRIHAEPDAFVGLRYDDPPGGVKHCLNSKIGSAELTLETGGRRVELRTAHRALFEILTDDAGIDGAVQGVPLRA